MREIKFRWIRNDVMTYDYDGWCEDIELNDAFKCIEAYGDITMQYTGLKDKNGKEIYEGDLLDKKFLWEVYFLNQAFYVRSHLASEANNDGLLSSINHSRYKAGVPLEVIGNIYENPDLLEK